MVPCAAQWLRERADSLGFNMGAAVRPSLFSERTYAARLAREFNMVEAEDAMKWWVIRPDQKTFDFTQGDQVVAFADPHRMKVRGHTLVWGWTNPPWLMNQAFPAEQLSELLHEHITRVVTHYRGKVFAWDVVNEAFDEHGIVEASLGYDQPGIGLAGKSNGLH
jgi:endo-1,4-beta-xylanase